jgi:hypothetical protein
MPVLNTFGIIIIASALYWWLKNGGGIDPRS